MARPEGISTVVQNMNRLGALSRMPDPKCKCPVKGLEHSWELTPKCPSPTGQRGLSKEECVQLRSLILSRTALIKETTYRAAAKQAKLAIQSAEKAAADGESLSGLDTLTIYRNLQTIAAYLGDAGEDPDEDGLPPGSPDDVPDDVVGPFAEGDEDGPF